MDGKAWARTGLAALFALTLGLSGARAEEPLKIKHGWVVMGATISPLIYEKPEILEHYGKSYTVEPIHFAGTSPQLVALATGEVDIIGLAYSSFANGIDNAGLSDMRIVADGFQDGARDYGSIEYLVRNDSGIKTIEDLKGKVLGINVIGAAVDIGARAVLKKHGLEALRDYTIIEAGFPQLGSMLLAGKVDVTSEPAPFLYAPELRQGAHPLFHMKDGMGTSQMIVTVARQGFLDAHRAALDDFFEDLVRGTHWMLDPANRAEAIALAARVTKQPASLYEPYFMTKNDNYRDPNGIPDLDAFQRNIDAQVQFGFLKHGFDVKRYADLSFIERAAKRFETASR